MITHEGIEWLDLEMFSDTPVFNTKAVVQQTGIKDMVVQLYGMVTECSESKN